MSVKVRTKKQNRVPAGLRYFLIILMALWFIYIPGVSLSRDQQHPHHKHSIKEMVTKMKRLNPFKKTKDDNAARDNNIAKKKGRKPRKPSVDSKGRATQPII